MNRKANHEDNEIGNELVSNDGHKVIVGHNKNRFDKDNGIVTCKGGSEKIMTVEQQMESLAMAPRYRQVRFENWFAHVTGARRV